MACMTGLELEGELTRAPSVVVRVVVTSISCSGVDEVGSSVFTMDALDVGVVVAHGIACAPWVRLCRTSLGMVCCVVGAVAVTR